MESLADKEARLDRGEGWKGTREAGVPMAIVVNPAVRRTHKGLPVSRTLPLRAGGTVVQEGSQKIKVHADGLRTDLQGRPIVATKADVKAVERVYGVERE